MRSTSGAGSITGLYGSCLGGGASGTGGGGGGVVIAKADASPLRMLDTSTFASRLHSLMRRGGPADVISAVGNSVLTPEQPRPSTDPERSSSLGINIGLATGGVSGKLETRPRMHQISVVTPSPRAKNSL